MYTLFRVDCGPSLSDDCPSHYVPDKNRQYVLHARNALHYIIIFLTNYPTLGYTPTPHYKLIWWPCFDQL